MSDFENLTGNDKELQEFLMIEKQKAQVNAQVNEMIPQYNPYVHIGTYI